MLISAPVVLAFETQDAINSAKYCRFALAVVSIEWTMRQLVAFAAFVLILFVGNIQPQKKCVKIETSTDYTAAGNTGRQECVPFLM